MKKVKKLYVKPLIELEDIDDDLMLTGSHTTTENFGDSPSTSQDDYPGYKGELIVDGEGNIIDPDNPGFDFYF